MPTVAAAQTQPNVLIFLLDDAGNSKISAYAADYTGYAAAADYLPNTETIDALAASGLRFSRAWATPYCSPTRASLQTGRQPYVHDVGYPVPVNTPELDPTAHQMLADSFTDAGYDTGYFGKWHLGVTDENGVAGPPTVSPYYVPPHPALAGWNRFFGNLDGDLDHYENWDRLGWVGGDQTGYVGVEATHATTRISQVALSWINGRTDPFLAMVAFNAPHSAGVGGWTYGEADPLMVRTPAYADCINGVTVCNQSKATYAALVEHVDLQIEQILVGMDPDVLANTLIVVMGDNGTPQSVQEGDFAATANRGKGTAYETGIRAPLIVAHGNTYLNGGVGAISYPGTVIRAGVHVTDVYQTLHEYALGYNVAPSEGADFTDCFTSNDLYCGRTPRQFGYTETFQRDASGDPLMAKVGIRYGHDKMVAVYDTVNDCMDAEFYDTFADQFEVTPLTWPVGNVRGDRLRNHFTTIHASAVLGSWGQGLAFCP